MMFYTCPACGRPRQTTADQAPPYCPTCMIDRRAFERAQALKPGPETRNGGLPA